MGRVSVAFFLGGLRLNIHGPAPTLVRPSQGFSNNAALGHLALSGVGNARARFSSPNGTSAALYVDMLEFQGDFAEKWESNLTVDSNFTIYFGGSNLPAEELDGALGGRL